MPSLLPFLPARPPVRLVAAGVFLSLAQPLPAAAPLQPLRSATTVQGPNLPKSGNAEDRPLWYFEIVRDSAGKLTWQYTAANPDGTKAGSVAQVSSVTWSPAGGRYAFATLSKANGPMINLKTLGSSQHVVALLPPRMIIGWQLAWSPDGNRLAFLTYTPPAAGRPREHSLFIMDTTARATRAPFVAEHRLPSRTLGNFPPLMAPTDKLRWSPDGKHILVSWANAIIVDVATGIVTTLHSDRAAAAWNADGRRLYYLAVKDGDNPRQRAWSGLYFRRLDAAEPVQLADPARLAELGLTQLGLNNGILDVSPDGRMLALGGGSGYQKGVLHVFPIAADGSVNLAQPARTHADLGMIASVEWAPTGSRLAILALYEPPGQENRASELMARVLVGSAETTTRTTVGEFVVPAMPAYLDSLAQSRLLSWSH